MIRVGTHYLEPRRAGYFALELATAVAAFAAAAALIPPAGRGAPGPSLAPYAGAALGLLAALSLQDLHDLKVALGDAAEGPRLLRALGGLLLLAALALVILRAGRAAALTVGAGLPGAALALVILRAALPQLEARAGLRTRLFLVGEGLAAHRLVREIQRDGTVEVVGFCGPRAVDLAARARAAGAHAVVVATDDRRGIATAELLACRVAGLEVADASQFAARALHRLPVELTRPADLIFGDGFTSSAGARAARRALSIAAALALGVATLPVLALAAVAIRLDSGGPVLFRQLRVGQGGRTFPMLKLRTMAVGAEAAGAAWAQAGDPRVTRVGRWLRRFRVDELPQLWNVLAGDMELVGPRPERPEFVDLLRRRIPFYDLRHLVPPGITGWAQVRYPYAASVEEAREKLQYDLYYVRHAGVGFDLYVLLLTARTILLARGAR